MESVYTVIPGRWGHENQTVQGLTPPREDQLIALLNDEGDPVLDENDEPVLVPGPSWSQTPQNIEVDVVTLVDSQGSNVFRFLMQPEVFPQFISHYVQYLSPEGRQVLRDALEQTSDLVVVKTDVKQALRSIPGGRR